MIQTARFLALTVTLAAAVAAQETTLQTFGPDCGAALEGTKSVELGVPRFDLRLKNAFPSAPVSLLFGSQERRIAIPGSRCMLLTDAAIHVPLTTDAQGRAQLRLPIPELGTGLYCQAMPIDAERGALVASNGVQLYGSEARFGPNACPPNKCSKSDMIIGCDNRKPGPESNSADKSPWNMVGKVYVNGEEKGSGTLIGAKWVLTAAHVVYGGTSFKSGSIGFALAQTARDCSKRPFGTRYVKRVFVPAAYDGTIPYEAPVSTHAPNKALDYAVLELANPILGGHVMQVQYLSWNTIKNRQATAIGYPYDAQTKGSALYARGSFATSQPYKWYSSGAKGLLRSSNDGAGGMSGGPVYVWHNSVRKLVGVFIGSPKPECQNGHVWSARMTPGAIEHIHNAKFFPPNGNVIDFFWKWHTPPLQADVNYWCGN